MGNVIAPTTSNSISRWRSVSGPARSETPAWLARYRNEVRLARKVTHVNVLRVYDLCEADGQVFISMEYVDGEDLAALLRRIGRLTGEKAVQVARQLCAAWEPPTIAGCCIATSSRPTS